MDKGGISKMKVYLFYQSFSNSLEPVLYGFTSDKLRAAIFKLYRPKLIQVIKDVSKSEYADMRNTLQRKEIIPHEFETSVEHFGSRKVSQIATEEEVMNIILHKEELVLKELSKHSVPLEIFTKSIQKTLSTLYMDTINSYDEEVVVYPWDKKNMPKVNFRVDELGLFVQLYGFTMREKSYKKKNT